MLEELDVVEPLPAAVLEPEAALPATWSHPDLKRLREEYRAHAVKRDAPPQSMMEAEAYGQSIFNKIQQLQGLRDQQKAQCEALAQQLDALRQGVESADQNLVKLQTVERSWKDQIIFHKTVAQALIRPQASLLQQQGISSDEQLDGGAENNQPPSAASPMPWYCPLSPSTVRWPPVSLRGFCPADKDAVTFLKRMAPWIHFSTTTHVLQFPTFSDDPCVLSSVSPAGKGGTCGNPICIYMHADQARHVWSCVEYLLQFLAPFRGKGHICRIGEFVDRMHLTLHQGKAARVGAAAPATATAAAAAAAAPTSAAGERRALVVLHSLVSFIVTHRLYKSFPLPSSSGIGTAAAATQSNNSNSVVVVESAAGSQNSNNASSRAALHSSGAETEVKEFPSASPWRINAAELYPMCDLSPTLLRWTLLRNWLISLTTHRQKSATGSRLTPTESILVDILSNEKDLPSMERSILRLVSSVTTVTPLIWRLLLTVREANNESSDTSHASSSTSSPNCSEGQVEGSSKDVLTAQLAWLAALGVQMFPNSPQLNFWQLSVAVRDPSVTEAECVQMFERTCGLVAGQTLSTHASPPQSSPSSLSVCSVAFDDIWSSALVVLVCQKFTSSEALASFLTSVLSRVGAYAPTPDMAYNIHVLLAAAQTMPYSLQAKGPCNSSSSPHPGVAVAIQQSSFLSSSDVVSPFLLPLVPISFHRYISLQLPQQLNSKKAQAAIFQLDNFVERSKQFLGEHSYRALRNFTNLFAFRIRRVDPTVFLQFVAQMEPDPYNSHVAFWDEYLATVMDFEGPLAVLEVCKALEVTGDMSLQLLAARHAIQAAPWTISHGEALLKAVAVFRKAHGIPHNDQQGGGSSGTMLRLAADPSTPARLKIPIPQWVSFLSAYATTTSCASPAEGFSILRAIPAQVLLADPCGGGGGGGGCSSSSLSGVRWRLLNDMAAMLMTMDVAEFLAGFGSLLADLTAEAPVETSATVSQQGVTVAHYFALEVYRGIPTVELRAERAARLRGAVISACIEYGCLHPLLWSHPPPARTGN